MAAAMNKLVHLSLPFLLLCFLHCINAQTTQPTNRTIIKLGYSIVAGTKRFWRSSSGEFAFGFHQIGNGKYIAGIVFDKIPERTLVWSANRDDPVEANSTVLLNHTGEFVLIRANGVEIPIYNGRGTSFAFMSNNGNLILLNSSSADPLWQSFDHPTDTLLPGQVLHQGNQLYSNANGTVDYSKGRFMLDVAADGNVLMTAYRYADPAYKYTGTSGTSVSVVFNQTTALLYVVNGTTIIYNFTSHFSRQVQNYYHRAVLDDQGNFQHLIRLKKGGSGDSDDGWFSEWKFIESPCMVSNICGVFGFCNQTNNNQTVNCECLEGYLPIDPNTPSKGCYPKVVMNFCSSNSSTDDFEVHNLENADFPFLMDSDAAMVGPSDAIKCKKAVENDCFCMAAVYFNNSCYKKRMPLLNARRSLPDTNGLVAFLKVPKIKFDSGKHKESLSNDALLAIFVVCSTFAVVFAAMVIYYQPIAKGFFKGRKSVKKLKPLEMNLKAFSFNELKEATNGFKNLLGKGSFGAVYNGVLTLRDQEVEVAVKQLQKVIEQGEKEFLTEVQVIGLTHHRNLLQLLGFCNEGDHRLLVYELMKNGPLSKFLFEGNPPKWETRAKIGLEIASGLSYLHEECETQIIHCDIKPQNILLDDNYAAKIADFGLAKLMRKNQTRTATLVRGTMGYMAPEWLKNAPVTTKVDVYSFGVMLLEIIFCRRHVEEEKQNNDEVVLVDWIENCARAGKLRDIIIRRSCDISEALLMDDDDYEGFERMTMVGLWCICPDPVIRPCMKDVLRMLDGSIQVGIPPLLL